MNETLTRMGARLLRTNILQPSTQPSVLTQRYDAVEELSTKDDMFYQTRLGRIQTDNLWVEPADNSSLALKSFHDVEKLLTTVRMLLNFS